MKSLIIIASVVALAFATPVSRSLVDPESAGPAPAPTPEVEPIVIGPTFIEDPIAVPAPVEITVPESKPMVQIIVNVNMPNADVDAPGIVSPGIPSPVIVPEPEPVEISPPVLPEVGEPVIIATPVLPQPVVLPEQLN